MGRSALFRWRTLDAVPFGSSLRIDWEVGASGLSLGSVQYWYADAWSATTQAHLQKEDLLLAALPERVVPRIEGGIEGESLTVIHADGESPLVESRIHQESAGPWSDDHHLVWRGLSPGRELLLGFDAPQQGRYRVWRTFRNRSTTVFTGSLSMINRRGILLICFIPRRGGCRRLIWGSSICEVRVIG